MSPQGLLLLVNHFIASAWYLLGSIVSNNWVDAPGLHGWDGWATSKFFGNLSLMLEVS